MKTTTCTLLAAAIVAAGCSEEDGARSDEQAARTQSLSVFNLRVGDCLVDVAPDADTTTVEAVPCAEPHGAQVLSTFELPDGPWPGRDAVLRPAEERCPAHLRDLPVSTAGLKSFYLFPTESSWPLGDHQIVCLATSEAPRRGSLPVR